MFRGDLQPVVCPNAQGDQKNADCLGQEKGRLVMSNPFRQVVTQGIVNGTGESVSAMIMLGTLHTFAIDTVTTKGCEPGPIIHKINDERSQEHVGQGDWNCDSHGERGKMLQCYRYD